MRKRERASMCKGLGFRVVQGFWGEGKHVQRA